MSRSLKVLVTGAAGQLGQALLRHAPMPAVTINAVTHAELDIGDAVGVQQCVAKIQPDVVINAAAYTAVDKAESEPELAERINVAGPRNLAAAVSTLPAARMIHVSTDFVFDGRSSLPYKPDAIVNPLSVYGKTKYQGERAVLDVLGGRGLIMRTAWVYSAIGKNFVLTMLRLMRERNEVRVVADQIGTPTSVNSLAKVVWSCVQSSDLSGIYHWTDAGVASWYDFAVAIAEEATLLGLLKSTVTVIPIATKEYPTPAVRPAYSVLDKSTTYEALDIAPVHWREELRRVLVQVNETHMVV